MNTKTSSPGWSKDNGQTDIRTVTPTAEHQQSGNQQHGQSTRQHRQQQQGSGEKRVSQHNGSEETLKIDTEDLNEQGDEKLTGDERGGD